MSYQNTNTLQTNHTRPDTSTEYPITAWPDGSPSVAMDIRLGKLGKTFDFDIDSYNKILDSEGIGDEREDLSIVFRAPEPNKTGYLELNGTFDSSQNLIGVFVNGEDEKANKFLHHETGHYVHKARGEAQPNIETANEIKRRAKLLKFAAPLGLVAIGSISNKLGYAVGDNLIGDTLHFTGGMAMLSGIYGTISAAVKRGTNASGYFLSYYTSGEERFAHKYTRKHKGTPIFSTSGK